MKVAKRQFALPKRRDGAGEDQPPVDPHRAEHRAPDRRRQVLLDEILEAEEIVGRAGLPVVRLGIDGPGRDLVVGGDLGPADGGLELVKPAELAQFGPEHAVILRQPARIVALNIDDMAVLDAHVSPRMMADYNRLGSAPRKNRATKSAADSAIQPSAGGEHRFSPDISSAAGAGDIPHRSGITARRAARSR